VEERGKNKKTVKWSIIVSLGISIAIIILILYVTVDANTLQKLTETSIKYEFFIIAIFLNILYWVFWAARLRVLSNAMDKKLKLGLWGSTKIVIANLFLASITPSMAGGEPVRIYLLNKEGMSFGSATAAVIGERLVDAIFILILVPIAFFIFHRIQDLGFIGVGLLIGIFVFIMLLIIFIYAILRPNKIKSFLIYLNKKLSRFSKKKESEIKIIKKINREVDNFRNGIICFAGEKKALFKASVLTFLFWSTGFCIPSMILLGLGLPPFFIESYAAQVLLLVIIMMPTTPGSAGIAEAGIFGLYGVLIGTSTESLIFVFIILYRFISYHMNLVAGAIFQYKIFKSVASFSLDMIKKD
jgi:uncharacterized protein (TIRG00374 family)